MLPNREELLERVSEAVRRAGALFGDRELAEQIRQKGVTDFVTQVDLTVQEQLRGALRAIAPEVQFMGEEQDNSGLDFGGAVWILDPVDGTMNLIHGFRHSAVSLALAEGGEVTMALVYDPFADELFTALAGRGAFCNGRPISVSGAERLADALVDVGTNPSEREKADRILQRQREQRRHEKNLREGKRKPWAVPPPEGRSPAPKKPKPSRNTPSPNRGGAPKQEERPNRPARSGGLHKAGPGGRKLSGKFRHHP